MQTSFNWDKFRKHVEVKTRVRHLSSEGILLDTSPYEDMAAALSIPDDAGEAAVTMRDNPLFVRIQAEEERGMGGVVIGYIPLMEFLVDGEWLTADQIMALP